MYRLQFSLLLRRVFINHSTLEFAGLYLGVQNFLYEQIFNYGIN